MTDVYVLLNLEGGDPVGTRRPGAPGKRYKSMGEAKMGINSARKCKLCGLKGHTARSNKCPVRKPMKAQNKDNVNVDEKNIKKKRNRLGKLRSSSAPSTLSNALQSEDESVAAESGEESSSADGSSTMWKQS